MCYIFKYFEDAYFNVTDVRHLENLQIQLTLDYSRAKAIPFSLPVRLPDDENFTGTAKFIFK